MFDNVALDRLLKTNLKIAIEPSIVVGKRKSMTLNGVQRFKD